MGSLERVQYKFASIIGELCSEPIVLSQFAVWLDLKLAEYKAKGSISLDCSGEKPEPPWMKGVLPSSPPSSLFEHKNTEEELHTSRNPFSKSPHSSYPSSSRVDHSSVTSPSQTFSSEELGRRLSGDDIILIKDEPLEKSDAYPTNVYPNESSVLSSDSFSDSRKRPSGGSGSNFSPHHQQLTQKVRRLANTSVSGSPSSASNQSSIGGIQQSPDPVPSTSCDDPMILPSPQPDPASQNSWLGQVTAERDSQASGMVCANTTAGSTSESAYGVSSQGKNGSRFKPNHNRSASTSRHVRAAVKNFERWLSGGPSRDLRKIEDIEPLELDGILADYFTNIKKPHGGDYTTFSLGALRSYLELYLKDQSYPESITRSLAFHRSQVAFRLRRLSLLRPEFTAANATIRSQSIQLIEPHVGKQDSSHCLKDRFSVSAKSLSTRQQIRGAVVNFEKWLRISKFCDYRRIDEIPPRSLDEYLAVYFSTLKKVTGEEYSIGSLKSLRSCIEHFLKEVGYPLSIIDGPKFASSQEAFKQKLCKLKERCLEETGP